jgi:3-hydroxyisobutyrate dehydrogenase-like beta-hydroxyacid dehydrogenase
MASLGFVGLGNMGSRMARRLLDAGHRVAGYNRTRSRAEALAGAGLRVAATPREAAEGAEAVFSMVADTDALESVARGPDGLVAGLGRGAVWLEMSTVSPGAARAMEAAVTGRGAAVLDAPVSGSVATLDAGQLAFMVGGEKAALERVRRFLLDIGPTITHMGPLGSAAVMKIAVNLVLPVQMLAFSEAILLAEKAGIPRERAVAALLRSVAASPMLKYRGPFVLEMPAEAWFDVGMMQKDLQLALDLARRVGIPLPTASVVQEMLSAARASGLGHHDFAVVFDVLARMSGLPPSVKTAGAEPPFEFPSGGRPASPGAR